MNLTGALAQWRVIESMPFGSRKEPGNCRKYKTVAPQRANVPSQNCGYLCRAQESCVVIMSSESSGSRSSWSKNGKVVKVVTVRTSRSVMNKGNDKADTQGNVSL